MDGTIVGTPDMIVEQINAYSKVGADELVLQWFDLMILMDFVLSPPVFCREYRHLVGTRVVELGGSALPQGDRKGPHSAPHHTRPYKDYEAGIGCFVSL